LQMGTQAQDGESHEEGNGTQHAPTPRSPSSQNIMQYSVAGLQSLHSGCTNAPPAPHVAPPPPADPPAPPRAPPPAPLPVPVVDPLLTALALAVLVAAEVPVAALPSFPVPPSHAVTRSVIDASACALDATTPRLPPASKNPLLGLIDIRCFRRASHRSSDARKQHATSAVTCTRSEPGTRARRNGPAMTRAESPAQRATGDRTVSQCDSRSTATTGNGSPVGKQVTGNRLRAHSASGRSARVPARSTRHRGKIGRATARRESEGGRRGSGHSRSGSGDRTKGVRRSRERGPEIAEGGLDIGRTEVLYLETPIASA